MKFVTQRFSTAEGLCVTFQISSASSQLHISLLYYFVKNFSFYYNLELYLAVIHKPNSKLLSFS